MKASQGKEIIIRTLNEIGVVAEISKRLSERGVSILAVSAWVEGADGVIHLVTDDNLRAMDCLRGKFEPREAGVIQVEVPHKPGMLRQITERLKGEGIDIHHLYATALSSHTNCLVVLATSHNDRALLALK